MGGLLLLSGCSDYRLWGKEKSDPSPGDEAPGDEPPEENEDSSQPVGECDSLVGLPAAQNDWSSCEAVTDFDPALRVEWELLREDETWGQWPIVLPHVGHADVILGTWDEQTLILDGRDGSLHETLREDTYGGPPTGARSSPDELLLAWVPALNESGEGWIKSYDSATGTSWASDSLPHLEGGAVFWRNLDGDPEMEHLTHSGTIDDDGTVLAVTEGRFGEWPSPCVGDFQGTGRIQLVNSYGVWDALTGDGTGWSRLNVSSIQCTGVLLDGEILILGVDVEAFLRRPDGTDVWTKQIRGGSTEYPIAAVGDVDGDGRPELVYSGNLLLTVLTVEGTVLWEVERGGQVGQGGPVLADLDADGSHEVIDLSINGLTIYRGSSGEILARAGDIFVNYVYASPVVADLDGDDSAEILVMAYDRNRGNAPVLRAYGAATGRWARTRPVWNQFAYDITSVADDGSRVEWPIPPWEDFNAWRAQPARDGALPDLTVATTDICCDDEFVHMAVQVSNFGSVEALAGSVVTLFTHHDDGWRAVATKTLPSINAAWAAEGILFDVALADWGDRQVVQVDGVDAQECDRMNDRVPVVLQCSTE